MADKGKLLWDDNHDADVVPIEGYEITIDKLMQCVIKYMKPDIVEALFDEYKGDRTTIILKATLEAKILIPQGFYSKTHVANVYNFSQLQCWPFTAQGILTYSMFGYLLSAFALYRSKIEHEIEPVFYNPLLPNFRAPYLREFQVFKEWAGVTLAAYEADPFKTSSTSILLSDKPILLLEDVW